MLSFFVLFSLYWIFSADNVWVHDPELLLLYVDILLLFWLYLFFVYGEYVLKFWSERRDRVVSTLVSYSGGPGFKCRPKDRLSWWKFFVVFLCLSMQIQGLYLKLRSCHFLSHPFQFVIHYYALNGSFVVWATEKTSSNKLHINSRCTFLYYFMTWCWCWKLISLKLVPSSSWLKCRPFVFGICVNCK